MKKLPAVFACALMCIVGCISCMHHHDGLSLSLTNSEEYYSMKASYDESKKKAVERYMDSQLGRQSNMSFANSTIDGKLTLEDHTTIYMKKSPGHLKIELDKDENSEESLEKVKAVGEELKGGAGQVQTCFHKVRVSCSFKKVRIILITGTVNITIKKVHLLAQNSTS